MYPWKKGQSFCKGHSLFNAQMGYFPIIGPIHFETGFWKKAGEHVFMYKLVNIAINMYTKVIFITLITLGFGLNIIEFPEESSIAL